MQFFHSLKELKDSGLNEKIDSQIDCIKAILQIVVLLQSWESSEDKTTVKFPYLYVDTDSLYRAFIVKNNSIESFHFPLYTNCACDGTINFYLNGEVLSSKIISYTMSVVDDFQKNHNKKLQDIVDGLDDSTSVKTDEVLSLSLFKFLLFSEMGYLRYDFDPLHQNSCYHPMCHLDINFTSFVTYKIGLSSEITLDTFIKIISKKEPCWLLKRNCKCSINRFLTYLGKKMLCYKQKS